MTIVQLAGFAKAKLWPDSSVARLPSTDPVTWSQAATPDPNAAFASAAVEVLVPRGATTGYALLGGSFAPSRRSAVLQITVLRAQDGEPFKHSIAAPPEIPVIALPDEYVQPTFEGASRALGDAGRAAAGKLTFDCAAVGAIGSNQLLFRQLGASIVRMLLGEMDIWDNVLRQELERS